MLPAHVQVTVGLCETQPATAAGLRSLLTSDEEFQIQWTTDNLRAAWHLIRQQPVQVVLLDKALGERAIHFALRQLREERLAFAVIWGAGISEPETLRHLQAGAAGVLLKTAVPETLRDCLRAVGSGSLWIETPENRESIHQPPLPLTTREHEVLALAQQGLRNRQIADHLGIATGTVKIHMRHIFDKTGVQGRFGLAVRGFKQRCADACSAA